MKQIIKFNRGNNKGIALILSVSILAILATIGCVFALNSLLDLNAASSYCYGLKAGYLAEAGVARAIAELKYGTEGARNSAVDDNGKTWKNWGYNATLLPNNSGYYASVRDCASRISLAANQNSNARISQILQNLSSIAPTGLTPTDCDNIAANRPYASKELVESVLTGSAAQKRAKYNAIKSNITIFGYVDMNTKNPQDVTTPYAPQPRSPVNINTAEWEVKAAVLTGITARHSCPKCGGDGYLFDVLGKKLPCPYCGGTGNLVIDAAKAQNLARWLEGKTYTSWDGFYSSVKSYFNANGATSSDQEVVMANANPNTGFSWCRNAGWGARLGYVGKYVIDINKNGISDNDDKGLTVSTTEFSFNSGGYYEIYGLGTVRNKAGIVVGQKEIMAVVKIFDTLKWSAQSQFEAAGSWKQDVQTYPEPSGVGISPAPYSGEIMLARKPHTQPNGILNPDGFVRADYIGTLSLDDCGDPWVKAPLNPPNPPSGPQGTKPEIGSVANFSNRGELAPDGMIVDTFDNVCPDYQTGPYPWGKINYRAGTLEVWFKTMWPSNDSMMYNDTDFNRKIFSFMSARDILGLGTKTWPFYTFVYYSQNVLGVAKSCSLGVQGYGFWNGSSWVYYPNVPEGVPSYYIEFARNYPPPGGSGPDLMGSWKDPGEWHQLVITWKEPDNGGMGNPPSTGAWPGTYPRDLKVYLDGAAKFEDFNFHHTTYNEWGYFQWAPGGGWYVPLTDSPRLFLMFGHEWWKGSGAKSHYERNQLNGIIGSVRIWDHVLAGGQIRAEYGEGLYQSSGIYISPPLTAPGGTPVEWGTITWTQAIPTSKESIRMYVDTGSGSSGGWTSPGSGQVIPAAKTPTVSFGAVLKGAGGPGALPDAQILLTPGFECSDIIIDWVHGYNPNNFYSQTQAQVQASGRGGVPVPHQGNKMAVCWYDGSIYQDVPVTAGKNYRFTGWAYIPNWAFASPNNGPSQLPSPSNWTSEIKFTMGSYFNDWYVHLLPRDQWNQVDTGWVTASAGTTSARVFLMTWQGGGIPANPTYFDDFALIEQGGLISIPTFETPVLEDVSITYLPRTKVLYYGHWR